MPEVGLQSTRNQVNGDLIIREVGREIGLLDPDEGPLITLLQEIPDGPPTPNPKFEFKEDDQLPSWVTTTAVVINAGVTAIPLLDSTPITVGSMLAVPAAANSANQPERLRVTAIDRGTHIATVVRAVGGVGAMNIPASTPLRIIGPAYGEGSVIPESIRTTPVNMVNYTQIFKHSADRTRTARQTNVYGMPMGQRAYDHKKMLVQHKRALNASALFGVPSESLNGSVDGHPIRTTGGLMSRITTNVFDMGGNISWNSLMAAANGGFRWGKPQKVLLCPGILHQAIHAWAMKRLLVSRTETVLGMRITTVETPYGTLKCMLDRSLENQAGVGFGNQAFILDMENFKRRVLAGNGQSSDTKIYENAIQDGRDREADFVMTECGWEIKLEQTHSRLYNITGFTELA